MSNCEKKLDALIDALGFDVEGDLDRESYNRQVMIQQQCGSNVQVDMSDHFQYKLTKRAFDISSEDYTDEMSRLHMVIRESNEYNRELYLANYELKKEIATLKTGKAFNEKI